MSQVLGFVVQAVIKNYEEICDEQGLESLTRWESGRVLGLRRYPWHHFVLYLDAMTEHLSLHGYDPKKFQLRLMPVLFRRLYAATFYRRALTPANILKMIETRAGPFMFRCGRSSFSDLGDQKVRIKIELHAELLGSAAFFQHCLAGMLAQLELMGFNKSAVRNLKLSDRLLEVDFLLEEASKPHHEELKSVHENLLYWLETFECGIQATDPTPDSPSLAESLAHLNALTQDLTSERGSVRDSLTIVHSRLQLAQRLGWTTPDGLNNRDIAMQQLALIKQILK
jgi:hypothetical protein